MPSGRKDGFLNQHVLPVAGPGTDLVGSREACRLLGVKPATLYAYVSRGKVRTAPGPDGRTRLYARDDLVRLKTGHDARAGHTAVAAGAMQWGQPVLDSALCRVDAAGPHYRGQSAVALALSGAPVESVAELLWTGSALPLAPWPAAAPADVRTVAALTRLPADAPPIGALRAVLMGLWQGSAGAFNGASVDVECGRARRLLRFLAAAPALRKGQGAFAAALRQPTVAHTLWHAFTSQAASAATLHALNLALVLCADHELNASAFAARVAAGTGADLHACVMAAMAAHSGPLHGAACDRVESLLASLPRGPALARALKIRVSRGEPLPGFGHPLYPQGDPRTPPLLNTAHQQGSRRASARHALALASAVKDQLGTHPTLDHGLVALCAALGLPRGSAVVVFALGRVAGWVAHTLEQRQSGVMLRPRARYVGP